VYEERYSKKSFRGLRALCGEKYFSTNAVKGKIK
jgi:hypothetical protein